MVVTEMSTPAGDVTVTYREGSSDELVIAEFAADLYGVKNIQSGERWLDIGANIGLFSVHAAAAGAVIEAFEPDKANFSMLQRNVDNFDHVTIWPLAVTPDGARVRLEQGEPQAFWQIKTIPDPHGSPSLELRRLITDGVRIKLDVEGAEQRLILGTPTKSWARVEKLVMEYHLDRLTLAEFAKAKAHLQSAGMNVSHVPLDPQRYARHKALAEPFIVTAQRSAKRAAHPRPRSKRP